MNIKFCPQCQTEYPSHIAFCAKDGAALRTRVDTSDNLIGEVLGAKYRVDLPLGSGAMGTVYKGYNLEAGKQVALKLIRCENAQDEAYRARFEQEKAIIGQLRHPNSITLYDSFSIDKSQLVIVTELVTGQTVEETLQMNAIPVDEVLFILREVADALVEAHGKGIVHRDLKPSNIMIEKVGDRNVVKVLDYGVARLHDSGLTRPSQPGLGTELYMSPEQRLGLPNLDGRSDIYSLGVVAYQCLANHSDFQGRVPERLSKRFASDMSGYGTAGPGEGVPIAVQNLIIECIAEKKEQRPANAARLRDRIDEIRYVSSPHYSRILAEQTGGAEPVPHVPLDSTNPESMIGRLLKDKYLIDSKLGAGAMGSVFKARDTDAQMDVAVKIVNTAWANNDEVVKRFEQEKSIIAQMRHPNILKLKTSFQTPSDELVIVTELVHGETLKERISKGDMPVQEALFILREVADALVETHAKEIIHRDLKPANLMLEELGDKLMVKVLDFGVAKVHDSKLTATGLTVGTLAYMSPEQLTAGELDGRSDIYSLGAIAYHCLASQTDFRGRGPEMLIQHFGQETGERASTNAVPADVEDLILDCLRRDPKRRPANARTLRDRADALRAKYSGYTNPPAANPPSVGIFNQAKRADLEPIHDKTSPDAFPPVPMDRRSGTDLLAAQFHRSKKGPALIALGGVILGFILYFIFMDKKLTDAGQNQISTGSGQEETKSQGLKQTLAQLKKQSEAAEAGKDWKAVTKTCTSWLKLAPETHPDRMAIQERRTRAQNKIAQRQRSSSKSKPGKRPLKSTATSGKKMTLKAKASTKKGPKRSAKKTQRKLGKKGRAGKRATEKTAQYAPLVISPKKAPSPVSSKAKPMRPVEAKPTLNESDLFTGE
ncbi:MAG: hypothetical protein CMO60_00360 [Verrucomicrobiales bacterium]|nr:hypothetical protein [Verrucomicrobiales bacterium]